MMKNNNYSPIRENTQEEPGSYFHEEQPSTSIWSACFPCFQQQTAEADSLLQENNRDSSSSSSWMVKKMKELKEYSELVAGPKWKNLVRKIGKYCNNPKKSSAKTTQFQYDSDSYALNFDNSEEDDDDGLFRNFSSRFAAPFSGSVANSNNPNRNAGL